MRGRINKPPKNKCNSKSYSIILLYCHIKWSICYKFCFISHQEFRYWWLVTHATSQLFKILKVDVVKMLQSICQQIWKTQQWSQHWKRSVFILIPKKSNVKVCSHYIQLHLFHTLAKLCSKSFKLSFSSMWTKNFQMLQAGY